MSNIVLIVFVTLMVWALYSIYNSQENPDDEQEDDDYVE
jgi:hypothetical protein